MKTANISIAMPAIEDSKLKDFFLSQLKDMYWVEKKLVNTLPKLKDAATSGKLKKAFNDHLSETKNHTSKLEEVFELLGEKASSQKCPAMAGIIYECEDIISETDENTAQRDVGLVFAGQKAEHYEIATYGGLIQLAETLEHKNAAKLLKEILKDEKAADSLLTEIAVNEVNSKAKAEKMEA